MKIAIWNGILRAPWGSEQPVIQRQLTSEALNSAQMLEVCVLRHGVGVGGTFQRGKLFLPPTQGRTRCTLMLPKHRCHSLLSSPPPSLLGFLPQTQNGLASQVQIPPACPAPQISDPAHFQGVPLCSCPSSLHALISPQKLREVSDSSKVPTQQINGRAQI